MSKKVIGFTIAGLTAAGIASDHLVEDAKQISKLESNVSDFVENILDIIDKEHTFTLAGHNSHASHASHASHGSHRSYFKPPDVPGDNLLRPNTGASSADSVATRNESSTPRSTILPSSPALTKKLKPLRGNSEKFRTIVAEAKVALLVKGFDVGTLDGQLDARAMAAIFKFQKSIGLPPDGKLTADVLSALNIRAT